MAHVLFPFGMRLSTFVFVLALLFLAAARREWRPVLALAAWMLGFEAVFEAAALAFGHEGPLGPSHAIFYMVLGPVVVFWAWRKGARPSLPLLAGALVVVGVWAATGFHVNQHTMVGFSPLAEALNEGAKTLWSLAYLLPLLAVRDPLAEKNALAGPGEA